ncbi:MAG: methyl-accepting chemotaxis protein [Bacteroidaceae bacterium]|nr:methyl-accepting chemotaxis protein [Bacteroidaceae bacterium]
MNILTYMRRSLAARLSFWVVSCVGILFIMALSILFHYSRLAVREEAMERATQILEGTLLYVEGTLHDVEVASDNMKWLVEQHVDTPDSMFTFSRQILENNPNLYGCSIAFEPYYYPEKGQFFSVYSNNNGDSIATEQEGSDQYEYYYMDWYLIAKLLNKSYWVEPFRESDVGGIEVNDYTTSYSQPIHDKNDEIVGILSVDLSLKWFSKTILDAKPFPHSYSVLLGRGGTFLVHPDSSKLFYETVFTPTLEQPDDTLTALGKAMVGGESGYKVLHRDGEDYYVFYRPFIQTGWSVAIVCPESDIFEPYYRLQKNLTFITLIGLCLLLFFCVFVIRHNLKPLKRLGISAEKMSEGDFNVSIPDSKRRDEIGQLQHSFFKMQQSLNDYINKIRHSTETLTQRNEELVKASELAKEDDRVKTAVIRNMTDQMSHPIDVIANESDLIRQEYKTFSEEEMAQHVDIMLENTEAVTHLLNQILEASDTTSLSNEDPAQHE